MKIDTRSRKRRVREALKKLDRKASAEDKQEIKRQTVSTVRMERLGDWGVDDRRSILPISE